MKGFESLHNHTTTSDGKMTYPELYQLAASRGFSVIAFTDHDALPSDEALAYLDSVKENKLKWIIGMEMTALLPYDLSEKGVVHIIGLFIDPRNPQIVDHARRAQDARRIRMEGMVKNLRSLGFDISVEECEEEAGGDSVGRPHIVRALSRHPKNEEVMEKIRKEMEEKSKENKQVKQKYDEMIAKGKHQYPYSLILSPDAFRVAYTEMTYIPDFDHAVKLIRDAGGLAFIAHYESVRKKLPLVAVEKLLKNNRIDGMETVYGAGYFGSLLEEEIHTERVLIREIVQRSGGFETGGGDIHTVEDMDRYLSVSGFAEEATGFSEKILKHNPLCSVHSSLEAKRV